MDKKISLVYFANVPLPNERANGVQIAHTCEGLASSGVNVTLVTRRPKTETKSLSQYYHLAQSFKHIQLFTLDIPMLPFRYFFRNASFFILTALYILIKVVGARVRGEKLVVYVRGETVLALIPLTYIVPIFFETHQIRNYEYLYKIALRRVRGVVVITEGLKNKFVEAYGLIAQKILVARDAVDVKKFESVTPDKNIWTEHGIAPTKKIVLYSGTLAPEKGVDTLAQAAPRVGENTQIVFLGGTDEQVTSFREKYGQVENISIIGRVDHVAVPKYLAGADAFVLPDSSKYTYSNLYTSPMKLFEYMASEHPIIASNVPSLLEVLDEKTAVFFEADNHESLAEVIERILRDTEEAVRLSHNARTRVLEFTWEKRTKAIVTHILEQIQ